MLRITSVHNPRVKAASRLRQRDERERQGRMLIDGLRELKLALAGGVAITELYVVPELRAKNSELAAVWEVAGRQGAELIEVTPAVMEKLAYGERREGLVAVGRQPRRKLGELVLPPDALVAVVEGLEKPGNLGAILRTADAAGLSAVIVADGRTDLYNPNAIRASLGALFTVPVCQEEAAAVEGWLAAEQFRLLAACVEGAVPYWAADYRGRVAILLGSEAEGLSPRWRQRAAAAVRLPMCGHVDSLNVSATAAVLFYEALRQRRAAASTGSAGEEAITRGGHG